MIVLHRHDANDGGLFAETLTGLDHVGFAVPTRADLEAWQAHLETNGVVRSDTADKPLTQSPIADEPYGSVLVFRDPDNIQLEFFPRRAAEPRITRISFAPDSGCESDGIARTSRCTQSSADLQCVAVVSEDLSWRTGTAIRALTGSTASRQDDDRWRPHRAGSILGVSAGVHPLSVGSDSGLRVRVGDHFAEDMLGEHRDGVVDEPDVSVAAGVVGELLAGQAGDERGPQVEVGVVAEPGSGEDGAALGEDLDGDGVGLGRWLEVGDRAQEQQLVAGLVLCGEGHEEAGDGAERFVGSSLISIRSKRVKSSWLPSAKRWS